MVSDGDVSHLQIRLNGVCRGYEGFNSCYMGRCWFGRCVQAVRLRFLRFTKSHHNENNELMLQPAQFRFARKARTAVLDGR